MEDILYKVVIVINKLLLIKERKLGYRTSAIVGIISCSGSVKSVFVNLHNKSGEIIKKLPTELTKENKNLVFQTESMFGERETVRVSVELTTTLKKKDEAIIEVFKNGLDEIPLLITGNDMTVEFINGVGYIRQVINTGDTSIIEVASDLAISECVLVFNSTEYKPTNESVFPKFKGHYFRVPKSEWVDRTAVSIKAKYKNDEVSYIPHIM